MTPEAHDQDEFRAWLHEEMRGRGLSIRQVAHRSGLSPSTVSRILNAERQPSLRTAVQIANSLAQGQPPRVPGLVSRRLDNSANVPDAVEQALRADARIDRASRDRILAVYRASRRPAPG